MFLIDKEKNEAISISKKTFQELEFKERQHLQEWISKNTDILGESLLIIQKEFSGFDDTKERLDLLAIDENGSLHIIENKLDDNSISKKIERVNWLWRYYLMQNHLESSL